MNEFTLPDKYDDYDEPKKHTSRKLAIAVLAVVVLAGAATGAYFLAQKPKTAAVKTSSQAQPAKTAASATPAPVSTTHYDSTNYNLGLDYPTGWTLADLSAGKLTVTSPVESLLAASGQTVSGKIILTIQNQQKTLPDFAAGNAVAVLASDNVAYKQPTSTQRANTYITYVQYAATTTNGALDGLYVTGNNGYQKDQAIPESDIVGVNPLITVTFLNCGTSACSSLSPLSVQATGWQKSQLASTVKLLLESLSLN